MKQLIRKIRQTPYERRLIIITVITMSGSAVLAAGKIVLGVFSDLVLCAMGVLNALLIVAKLWCVLGAVRNEDFHKHNTFTACFLFSAGLLYALYMGASLLFDIPQRAHSQFISIMLAAIAFAEMGVAIYGLIRTKRKGHFYRNIKIIGFSSALIAIMTAQVALLGFANENDMTAYNAYAGIAVGGIIMLLGVYMYFAPRISTIDREHNVYRLIAPERNRAVDMTAKTWQTVLCKSKIYGDYMFCARIDGDIVDGHIVKGAGIWRRMHILVKILCIVLSEILVFVWAIGYAVYFVRTVDMPSKLDRRMQYYGFEKLPAAYSTP